jgi:hypothetical protein
MQPISYPEIRQVSALYQKLKCRAGILTPVLYKNSLSGLNPDIVNHLCIPGMQKPEYFGGFDILPIALSYSDYLQHVSGTLCELQRRWQCTQGLSPEKSERIWAIRKINYPQNGTEKRQIA